MMWEKLLGLAPVMAIVEMSTTLLVHKQAAGYMYEPLSPDSLISSWVEKRELWPVLGYF